jgi:hypothetical protein
MTTWKSGWRFSYTNKKKIKIFKKVLTKAGTAYIINDADGERNRKPHSDI